MATERFFDAARLGRMRPTAQRADRDFTQLASRLGSPLYWGEFLSRGYEGLPLRLRAALPGLAPWRGVGGLQASLADLVRLPASGRVFLAERSSTLVTLAAEALFERCERVLATDLEWPPYLALLKRVAHRTGKGLVVARVRQRVLAGDHAAAHLIERVVTRYRLASCDGYFLSHVTCHGVRMPLAMLVERLLAVRTPRLGVVDGAQGLAHMPIDLASLGVDLYLAGAHKWLGGYLPLRIGFAASDTLDATRRRLVTRRVLDDPLMTFCDSVTDGRPARWGETVNLAPLVTTAGALAELTPTLVQQTYATRRASAAAIFEALPSAAPAALHPSLHSGAALVRAPDHSTAGSLRLRLAQRGVVASEPLPGLVRLAMPESPLTARDLDRLRRALGMKRRVAASIPQDVGALAPHPPKPRAPSAAAQPSA